MNLVTLIITLFSGKLAKIKYKEIQIMSISGLI